MKPKIYVVGFGPGERPYMTQQAVDAMTQADLVVGYTTYVRLLEKQFPELQYYATPMRKETDRITPFSNSLSLRLQTLSP